MILMRSKYAYSCDFGDIRLFYLNDFGKKRKEDTGDSAQFNNIFSESIDDYHHIMTTN